MKIREIDPQRTAWSVHNLEFSHQRMPLTLFKTTSNAEIRSVATKRRYSSVPSRTKYRSRTFPQEINLSVSVSGRDVSVIASFELEVLILLLSLVLGFGRADIVREGGVGVGEDIGIDSKMQNLSILDEDKIVAVPSFSRSRV